MAEFAELKEKALFILSQSSSPRAREILVAIARGERQPDKLRDPHPGRVAKLDEGVQAPSFGPVALRRRVEQPTDIVLGQDLRLGLDHEHGATRTGDDHVQIRGLEGLVSFRPIEAAGFGQFEKDSI